MSFRVGYSTQIGPFPNPTQGSQAAFKMHLVYTEQMNQTQTDLMSDAKSLLEQSSQLIMIMAQEVKEVSKQTKYFIIPYLREDIVTLIKTYAEKPIIYTARVIIEALKYRNTKLPIRTLAISMSMMNCQVFLVKACNTPDIKNKVLKMCGTIVEHFNDPLLNVVVTDRSDNRYCSKARSREVAVVSTEWINETYSLSRSDECHFFSHDAMTTLSDHQIKPFLGLKFKINIPHLTKPLRVLIGDNQGKLVFGDEDTNHIVSDSYPDNDHQNGLNDSSGKAGNEPRVVDVEFLETCANLGYYLNRREYRSYRDGREVRVKQEKPSQTASSRASAYTPSQPFQRSTLSSIRSNGRENRINENSSAMPPPPTMPRLTRQQVSESMNDLILRQLENGTQVQTASTQIRRLPETEIQFEPTLEPSQQLYWSDSISKQRH